MKVSIITATYNSEKTVRDTIESVLSQDYQDIEYIIVDGKSKDNTLNIVNEYREHIATVVSEPDKGIYDAMNKGIKLATGKYLYFLGAGDCLCNNVISKLKDILNIGKYDFIYGNTYNKVGHKIRNKGKFGKFRILFTNICHQGIFYKRKIFEIYGVYSLKYKVLADYELNIKCIGNDKIKKYYVNKFIAIYEGGGYSDKHLDVVFEKDINNIVKENLGYFYYIIRVMFVDLIKALQLK